MNSAIVESVVHALLFEGYALYPYRPSIKSQHRWTFGGIYPPAWNAQHPDDRSFVQLQCLVLPANGTELKLSLRYLQPYEELGLQKAHERKIDLPKVSLEQLLEHPIAERLIQDVTFIIRLSAVLHGSAVMLTVRVENETQISPEVADSREKTMLHSLASAHILLHAESGQFISLTDPPDALRVLASQCQNIGCWPVLVGEHGATDALLASPLIVNDYPQIASQSPGDLFDGTEIDEILTLRILTLTDEEKRKAAEADGRIGALLLRTESIARQQLTNLHGTWTEPASLQTSTLKVGDRVILHPKKRADILDVALAGQSATITAVETDYESKTHLAVTIDSDPGKDLGVFGHRFFFSPEEVELVAQASNLASEIPVTGWMPLLHDSRRSSILIAGIGNIFLGDDAFGCEVIRELLRQNKSFADTTIKDFGIRGIDLSYELIKNYDAVILIDACSRGEKPGTLFLLEPQLEDSNVPGQLDPHSLDPVRVLQAAKAMGAQFNRIVVLGCEPSPLPGDEDEFPTDLTPAVRAAIPQAIRMIEGTLSRFRADFETSVAKPDLAGCDFAQIAPAAPAV